MIIPLQKILFVGTQKELTPFFEEAQEIGQIQFQAMEAKPIRKVSSSTERILHALRIIRRHPKSEQLRNDFLPTQDLVDRILICQDELDQLEEEKRLLLAKIREIEPFGQFSIEDRALIERDGRHHLQFFSKKRKQSLPESLQKALILLKEGDENTYYLSISKEKIKHPSLQEHYFDASLEEMLLTEEKLKKETFSIQEELKQLTQYESIISDYLNKVIDAEALASAKDLSSPFLEGKLFLVEGWVDPSERAWRKLAFRHGILVEPVALEKEERPPTFMKNKNKGARLGQDLVEIYDTPSIADSDPSWFVLISFVLFFSMIISDAGYGFIYLILSLAARRFFKEAQGVYRRFFNLATLLSLGCIFWGCCAGSYFALKIEPSHFLNRYSILYHLAKIKAQYAIDHQQKIYQDWITEFPALTSSVSAAEFLEKGIRVRGEIVSYPIMETLYNDLFFEISILIGIFHISIALLKGSLKEKSQFGWFCSTIGAYLYLPFYLKTTTLLNESGLIPAEIAPQLGIQLMIFGICISLLFALIKRGIFGIFELFNAFQIFADVLSYLRIYALALASMILATTFNSIAYQLGLFKGILILLIGHGLNMILGLMGGAIHGLRLNFLEWYRYCFEGGGRPFIPLVKRR